MSVALEIPELNMARRVNAIIVPPSEIFQDVDGFACFRFLNSFSYGNFGDQNTFGLELS